jgi:hypothetical protein
MILHHKRSNNFGVLIEEKRRKMSATKIINAAVDFQVRQFYPKPTLTQYLSHCPTAKPSSL